MIRFETIKPTTAACSGRMSDLAVGIRMRNKHNDILVNIRVANVWSHSP